jgi:hypothetical protein
MPGYYKLWKGGDTWTKVQGTALFITEILPFHIPRVFSHLTFIFYNLTVKLYPLKISLSLVPKSIVSQSNLKWGFRCICHMSRGLMNELIFLFKKGSAIPVTGHEAP